MKFSRCKKIKFVKFTHLEKKNKKTLKIEVMREKNVENLEKKLFDKNDP